MGGHVMAAAANQTARIMAKASRLERRRRE